MKVKGYMNEVSWDGRELRAKGTNKMSHRALLGYTDVDLRDHLPEDQDELEALGIEEVRRRGKQAIKEVSKLPDELVLAATDITHVELKPARRLTNGRLVVHAASGRKYELHFRRKSNDDFSNLFEALRLR